MTLPRLARAGALSAVSTVLFLGGASLVLETLDLVPTRTHSPVLEFAPGDAGTETDPAINFRFHPRWFWEPIPGSTSYGTRVNDDGYRGPRFARERGAKLRIATLGDSSTFGVEVPEEMAWSRRLEQALRARGEDAEVLNFGVVGFTAFQGLQIYRGRVRAYRPDVVIAAFGCVNEQFHHPLSDAGKFAVTTSAGFRAGRWLDRFALVRWLRCAIRGPEAPVGENDPQKQPVRMTTAEFKGALGEIAALQRKDGHAFVLVSPPRLPLAEFEWPTTPSYTEAVHQAASELGAPLADVYAEFRGHDDLPAEGQGRNRARRSRWFHDVVHPSPEGHDAYARVVVATLESAGIVAPAPR